MATSEETTKALPAPIAHGTVVGEPAAPKPPPAAADAGAAKRVGALPGDDPELARKLRDLPAEQLEELAFNLGVDPRRFDTRAGLVAAVYDRKRLIGTMSREALLDVLRWSGRGAPPAGTASREQLAQQAVAVKSMRFSGLSHRGLVVLAQLRGVAVPADAPTPELVQLLKRQEGFFAKLGRKRRAIVGKMVSRMLGEEAAEELGVADGPPKPAAPQASSSSPRAAPEPIRPFHHEAEERGLLATLTDRVKRSADGYVNQKLDEVEQRIDRKLDEIDRRLGEWRDKEVANRLRILKITLWATCVVAAASLLYSYVWLWWEAR